MKVVVIKDFTLKDFDKLRNLIRKDKDEKGSLFVGDVFECDDLMYQYLRGANALNLVVVEEIIDKEEVVEEAEKEAEEEPKKEKKSKKKK